CGYLFAAAKAGNIPAIIFWLKTRARWREEVDAQATDAQAPHADADADADLPALLVLPDNSRDAELTQVLRNAQEAYFARRQRGPTSRTQDLIAWGSEEEEQVVPTELAADIPTAAAGNWFPGEGGQSTSALGV